MNLNNSHEASNTIVPVVDLILNVTGCPPDERLPLDANYWRRHARGTGEVRGIDSCSSRARNSDLPGDRTCAGADRHGPAMSGRCQRRPGWPHCAKIETTGPKCSRASERSLCSVRNRIGAPTTDRIDAVVWRCRPTRSNANDTGFRLRLLIPPANGRARLVIRCWVCMCRWPAVPVSMFGLERLSLERCPWMDDHRVQGVAVVPAAAYVEMAIAAAVEAGLRATGSSHADRDRERAAAQAGNRV